MVWKAPQQGHKALGHTYQQPGSKTQAGSGAGLYNPKTRPWRSTSSSRAPEGCPLLAADPNVSQGNALLSDTESCGCEQPKSVCRLSHLGSRLKKVQHGREQGEEQAETWGARSLAGETG